MNVSRLLSTAAPIILMYGAEGRGKTTLAASFEQAIFFLLERGLPRGISVDAVENVDSFEGIMSALRDLYATPGGYKTLVVDTVDMLEAHVNERVCAEKNWKSIEDGAYGKGFVFAETYWRHFLRAVSQIRDRHGMTIVLVCHASIERIDDPRAPTYTSYLPKLHKRARGLVMDAADVIGFLAEDLRVVTSGDGLRERVRAEARPARYLFVEGRPAFAAKNRYNMPEKIEIPKGFDVKNLTKFWSSPESEGVTTND
jgi:AAA domain